MNIWINKNSSDLPDKNFDNAYIFSLNRKGYSTIFTNLSDTWLRLGALSIESIYEDLFIIALSIFAIEGFHVQNLKIVGLENSKFLFLLLNLINGPR